MKAQVTFNIEAPCKCTPEQFKEWLEIQLATKSKFTDKNPLKGYYLEGVKNTNIEVEIEKKSKKK